MVFDKDIQTDGLVVLPSLYNAYLLIKNDEKLKGRISCAHEEISRPLQSRNKMFISVYAYGAMPWALREKAEGHFDWTDADDAGLRLYLNRKYGVMFPKNVLFDAVNLVAIEQAG